MAAFSNGRLNHGSQFPRLRAEAGTDENIYVPQRKTDCFVVYDGGRKSLALDDGPFREGHSGVLAQIPDVLYDVSQPLS